MLTGRFEESDKLMVINLLYLGDLIFSLPLLAELKSQCPRLDLCVVANDNFACLLQEADFVDELVGFDKSADLFSSLESARALRNKEYNVSLNIHGNWRSTLLQRLACPGYRAGYNRCGQRLLLDFYRQWQPRNNHLVEYQLQWLEVLGLKIPENPVLPAVEPTSKAVASAQALLQNNLPAKFSNKYIILNSGGSWPSKRWPPEKFAQLGCLIMQDTDAGLILTGSEADKERNSAIKQEILSSGANNILEARIFNSAGQTSIPELMALIKKAELVVSGDTGPVHVASLTETPLIALFGPSDEKKYRPYRNGENTRVIKNKRVDCRPCGEQVCPQDHRNCIDNISVADVWKELLTLFNL